MKVIRLANRPLFLFLFNLKFDKNIIVYHFNKIN